MRSIYSFLFIGLLALSFSVTANAQQTGSVEGVVQDTLGAVVVGATVTAVDSAMKEKTATTNQRGEFSITGLAPGKYTVKVFATNFALYENTEVQITAGKKKPPITETSAPILSITNMTTDEVRELSPMAITVKRPSPAIIASVILLSFRLRRPLTWLSAFAATTREKSFGSSTSTGISLNSRCSSISIRQVSHTAAWSSNARLSDSGISSSRYS